MAFGYLQISVSLELIEQSSGFTVLFNSIFIFIPYWNPSLAYGFFFLRWHQKRLGTAAVIYGTNPTSYFVHRWYTIHCQWYHCNADTRFPTTYRYRAGLLSAEAQSAIKSHLQTLILHLTYKLLISSFVVWVDIVFVLCGGKSGFSVHESDGQVLVW